MCSKGLRCRDGLAGRLASIHNVRGRLCESIGVDCAKSDTAVVSRGIGGRTKDTTTTIAIVVVARDGKGLVIIIIKGGGKGILLLVRVLKSSHKNNTVDILGGGCDIFRLMASLIGGNALGAEGCGKLLRRGG